MERTHENSIDEFIRCSDDSWIAELNGDPETKQFEPNKKSREVKSGHYVLVEYDLISGRALQHFIYH
jgi:hypothetical protein